MTKDFVLGKRRRQSRPSQFLNRYIFLPQALTYHYKWLKRTLVAKRRKVSGDLGRDFERPVVATVSSETTKSCICTHLINVLSTSARLLIGIANVFSRDFKMGVEDLVLFGHMNGTRAETFFWFLRFPSLKLAAKWTK